MFLAVANAIDKVTAPVGKLAAWCVTVAIVVSAGNAVARKIGYSSNAWLELQSYLFGATFMLCSAWVLKENEHIRVDIVYSRLRGRTRNWIDLFGFIVFMLPFVSLMAWFSTPFFLSALQTGEHSGQSGGLLVWPARAVIVAGFALLCAQGISEIIKRALLLAGDDHSEPEHTHVKDAPHG